MIRIGGIGVRWELPVIAISVVVMIAMCAVKCSSGKSRSNNCGSEAEVVKELLYGFDIAEYDVVEGNVGSGQTLSYLLEGYASPLTINRIVAEAKPTYNFNRLRAGNKYAIFSQSDSTGTARLRHFVLETSSIDLLYVSVDDSLGITVHQEQKEQRLVRRKVSGQIAKGSHLYGALKEADAHDALAAEMEDIFGWSVDFFSLQEGDSFTVIFEERYVEDKCTGIATVWGALFNHHGKDYYAIPFDQGGKLAYWDENGKSMRKQFLKAPLKYTRISSGFSYARRHPITKKVRPHLGVDYAAPTGTPVMAIADGTITHRYWDKKGGGNVLKIKHTNGYESSYLHLHGFAKGMVVGKHVSQGQVIAYVGSTGMSTGPHLDFRVKKNGSAINPTKLPSASVEPINKANQKAFERVCAKVMAELAGEVSKREQIGMHDLYPDSYQPEPLSEQEQIEEKAKSGAVWKALEKL